MCGPMLRVKECKTGWPCLMKNNPRVAFDITICHKNPWDRRCISNTHSWDKKNQGCPFFSPFSISTSELISIKIKTNIDNILSININNKLVLAVATDIINMREVLFLQTIYLNHCFEKRQKSKNVLHHKLLYNYCISKNIFVPFGLRFYWIILNKNMKMIIMMNIIHGYCSQRVLFFLCISTSPDIRSGTVVVPKWCRSYCIRPHWTVITSLRPFRTSIDK